MLTQEQISEFEEAGFLNGGQALSADEVEELRGELERILEIGPDGFSADMVHPVSFRNMAGDEKAVWQIVNIWEASAAFERLIYHPFVVGAISQLTGQADLMVWHDQIQYKPASYGGATRWHQDAPLWPIIRPMTPVSAWIPLDDADEENGCMWMVPGSYKWGDQIEFLRTQGQLVLVDDFGAIEGFTPPAGIDAAKVQPRSWPVKKGEVSFHHSLTWHGSPFNHSARPRRAIAIHYMTGEACFDASGEHLMKEFVDLEDGAPMAEAGPHFPQVCKGGEVVSVPEKLVQG
jgi:phytanoyl-CoA hydroxylase